MKMATYTLSEFKGDKHHKIQYIVRKWFEVKPKIRILGVELEDVATGKKMVQHPTKQESKHQEARLIDWIFKRSSCPATASTASVEEHSSGVPILWTVSPAWTDEDKEHIKFLYLLEEL